MYSRGNRRYKKIKLAKKLPLDEAGTCRVPTPPPKRHGYSSENSISEESSLEQGSQAHLDDEGNCTVRDSFTQHHSAEPPYTEKDTRSTHDIINYIARQPGTIDLVKYNDEVRSQRHFHTPNPTSTRRELRSPSPTGNMGRSSNASPNPRGKRSSVIKRRRRVPSDDVSITQQSLSGIYKDALIEKMQTSSDHQFPMPTHESSLQCPNNSVDEEAIQSPRDDSNPLAQEQLEKLLAMKSKFLNGLSRHPSSARDDKPLMLREGPSRCFSTASENVHHETNGVRYMSRSRHEPDMTLTSKESLKSVYAPNQKNQQKSKTRKVYFQKCTSFQVSKSCDHLVNRDNNCAFCSPVCPEQEFQQHRKKGYRYAPTKRRPYKEVLAAKKPYKANRAFILRANSINARYNLELESTSKTSYSSVSTYEEYRACITKKCYSRKTFRQMAGISQSMCGPPEIVASGQTCSKAGTDFPNAIKRSKSTRAVLSRSPRDHNIFPSTVFLSKRSPVRTSPKCLKRRGSKGSIRRKHNSIACIVGKADEGSNVSSNMDDFDDLAEAVLSQSSSAETMASELSPRVELASKTSDAHSFDSMKVSSSSSSVCSFQETIISPRSVRSDNELDVAVDKPRARYLQTTNSFDSKDIPDTDSSSTTLVPSTSMCSIMPTAPVKRSGVKAPDIQLSTTSKLDTANHFKNCTLDSIIMPTNKGISDGSVLAMQPTQASADKGVFMSELQFTKLNKRGVESANLRKCDITKDTGDETGKSNRQEPMTSPDNRSSRLSPKKEFSSAITSPEHTHAAPRVVRPTDGRNSATGASLQLPPEEVITDVEALLPVHENIISPEPELNHTNVMEDIDEASISSSKVEKQVLALDGEELQLKSVQATCQKTDETSDPTHLHKSERILDIDPTLQETSSSSKHELKSDKLARGELPVLSPTASSANVEETSTDVSDEATISQVTGSEVELKLNDNREAFETEDADPDDKEQHSSSISRSSSHHSNDSKYSSVSTNDEESWPISDYDDIIDFKRNVLNLTNSQIRMNMSPLESDSPVSISPLERTPSKHHLEGAQPISRSPSEQKSPEASLSSASQSSENSSDEVEMPIDNSTTENEPQTSDASSLSNASSTSSLRNLPGTLVKLFSNLLPSSPVALIPHAPSKPRENPARPSSARRGRRKMSPESSSMSPNPSSTTLSTEEPSTDNPDQNEFDNVSSNANQGSDKSSGRILQRDTNQTVTQKSTSSSVVNIPPKPEFIYPIARRLARTPVQISKDDQEPLEADADNFLQIQ